MTAEYRYSVRITAGCLSDLRALAKKENRSLANMIEQLARRAQNDPDGYFLRMAAMQSYIAAMTSLNLMARFVDEEEQIRIVKDVGIQARQVYGGMPRPPAEVHDPKNKNALVEAFLDVYEQRRKEQRG